jgi:hypothetical protein
MRPILSASLMAILAAISISACSNSSSAANTADNAAAAADNSAAAANNSAAAADNSAANADNSAATTDNSAAAAPAAGDASVYPGAKTDTPPGASGTPPPGVAGYSTTDGLDKVEAWYTANLKGGKVASKSALGEFITVGDAKTGTVVMIQSASGKVYIVTGPSSAMAH